MKTSICGLLFVLASCTQQQPNNTPAIAPVPNNSVALDTVMVHNPELAKLKIDFGGLTEIDETGVMILPLVIKNEAGGMFESSSYKLIPGHNYWNIVFYNSKTSEYYLLGEQKMLIKSIMDRSGLEYTDTKNSIDSNFMLFEIITDDFNKDGLLDEKDPTYLFATDRTGKNLRQLSPANQQLNSWKYITSTGKIIMRVKADTDKNLLFDEKDQTNLVGIDLSNEKDIKSIFSDSFQLRLKVLFDRDWKKKKD